MKGKHESVEFIFCDLSSLKNRKVERIMQKLTELYFLNGTHGHFKTVDAKYKFLHAT